MRTQRIRLIIAVILAGLLGLAVGGLMSASAQSGDDTSGVTNASIYRTGRNINVTGTVNGDIFCAGQTVDINATVNGDVICAGQTVNLNGKINGSVRLAGQTVTVDASASRSVSIVGQDVTINSSATVGKDLSLAAQTATVNGKVSRDLTATVNDLIINNTISRNLSATVAKLELQDHAVVNGSLTYYAEQASALHKASGAKVNGGQTFHQRQVKNNRAGWGRTGLIWRIYWEGSLIIFSLVLAALFPQLFDSWNQVARRRFWLSLLAGFLAMFIVPAVVVALFISIIGVPLALLLGLVWLVVIALSAPVAAYYIGSLILHGGTSIPLIMLLGAVILALLCLIPIVGWIIAILAYWFGTGAILLNLRGGFARPRYHAAPEPHA